MKFSEIPVFSTRKSLEFSLRGEYNNIAGDKAGYVENILKGDMAIVGPRPALWNQYDLIEERDKYHANDILPGLTGWAQVNGRDELEIDVKAKLDGEYVQKMSFGFDCKCFWMTITSVLKHEGVVEGGTGTMHKK